MAGSSNLPLVNAGALPRAASGRPSSQARMVEGLVQPEVWTMYDTILFGATAGTNDADYVLGSSGTVPSNGMIPMFNSHTIGSRGVAVTSMTTSSGYVDFPFKAFGIGVDVYAPTENATTAGVAGAIQFVETIVSLGSITLQFATDYKLIMPISDLPGGGGVEYGPCVQENETATTVGFYGNAGNGLPTVQARALWKDYILFRGKDTPFTINLVLQKGAVALLNSSAQPALGTNKIAGVRVKFWGYRGKSLITGAPFRG